MDSPSSPPISSPAISLAPPASVATPPAPPVSPALQPRLVAQINLVWQHPDGRKLLVAPRFARLVTSNEAPYQRTVKVGKQPVKVDYGWVEEPGLVVVENRPTQFVRRPSPEEREVADAKAVEVTRDPVFHDDRVDDLGILFPGEGLPFCCILARPMYLRCQQGETEVTVTVFPR